MPEIFREQLIVRGVDLSFMSLIDLLLFMSRPYMSDQLFIFTNGVNFLLDNFWIVNFNVSEILLKSNRPTLNLVLDPEVCSVISCS